MTYPSGAFCGAPFWPYSTRLACKVLPNIDTLAYFVSPSVTEEIKVYNLDTRSTKTTATLPTNSSRAPSTSSLGLSTGPYWPSITGKPTQSVFDVVNFFLRHLGLYLQNCAVCIVGIWPFDG
jgi:hypothetical protein